MKSLTNYSLRMEVAKAGSVNDWSRQRTSKIKGAKVEWHLLNAKILIQ